MKEVEKNNDEINTRILQLTQNLDYKSKELDKVRRELNSKEKH